MDEPAQSYFSVVARRWKLLAAVTFVPTIVAVLLVVFVIPKEYRGECKVIFPLKQASSFMRRSLTELDIPIAGMSGLLDSAPTLYNHIAIIESRTLSGRVYDYLKNEKDIDMLDVYERIRDDDDMDEERRLRAVVRLMRRKVKVDDSDRGLAVISFLCRDRAIAAAAANAYVTETLAFLNEVNKTTQSELVTFLEARQIEIEESLTNAEAEIQRVKEETGILSIEGTASQLIESYAEIEALVAQAEIEYQGSLSTARGMSEAGMDMEDYYAWLAAGEEPGENPPPPAIEALADQTIARLRSDLSELELERQQAMLWATPDNPEVLILEAEIEAIRRELYREFADYYDATIASLVVQSTAFQAQLDVAEEILVELDSRLDEFPPEERLLIELERDRDVQESIYLVVREELEQARIQELRESQPFTVLDEALLPRKAAKPRYLMITVGTFALSFWLGIFVVFAVDATSRRRAAEKG